ncbi:hypothetical protein Tco_0820460 [Tanacetum coccineum]|uniref:Uncharacterized protein n=1 Tax=Tanacetum coccineum TaxID=301880 RepID=A0ABQ5AAD8_9ASTR
MYFQEIIKPKVSNDTFVSLVLGCHAKDWLYYVLETQYCEPGIFVIMLWAENLSSDEEVEGPMKDQPLSADASPTALSPGYIANSDPEEDKEDPEEDPADHPADG